MLKIDHKFGGRLKSISAIGHVTSYGKARWFFVARVAWETDPPLYSDPDGPYEVTPALLCAPSDGDRSDYDRALNACAEYLRINGEWNQQGEWVPHKETGRVEVQL